MSEARAEVSILIVGYNSGDYLDDCLASIPAATTRHSYEILLVNNGDDGSEERIGREYPQVRVLDTIGNVGFAAGNNYLAEHARGRWLLLLNPDTRLYPAAIDTLLDAAARHPQFDVLGGVTVGHDGEPQSRAQLRLPTLGTLLADLVARSNRPPAFDPAVEVIEADALSGGFMMVRGACWERLGGLDPGYFLYAEELDFFKRLKDAGGRAAQVPGSRVFHDLGSGDVYSPTRIRFMVTGNAHYLHKHFVRPYAYAGVLLMWITMVRRHAGGALLARKGDRYARLSRGFSHVARAPWTWMWGYSSAGADPRLRAPTKDGRPLQRTGSGG